MNRERMVERLANETFDVLIIGGGATGLGAAVDAAARGFRTALVEGADFASGTSSRSTKLIHGGVRYLAQGNIALVREALHERTLLLHNAPHLVFDLPFVVPAYSWAELALLTAGLSFYDRLAGKPEFGRTQRLSAAEARESIPQLQTDRLRGAVAYHDGQFDDARLAITLARTAADLGAALANYTRAVALLRINDRICGATVEDRESGARFPVQARVVINAAGTFADSVRMFDDASVPPVLRFSRGSHITVGVEALGSANSALLVSKTPDARVLFAIPWHDRIIVGTTDVAVDAPSDDPRPSDEEIVYIIETLNRYLQTPLQQRDVLASFAGIRPLIAAKRASTSRLPREHLVDVSPSGLVTVTGGKWTTYRKMAQDAVDTAIHAAGLPFEPCSTQTLLLRGAQSESAVADSLRVYGTDASAIETLVKERPQLGERLHRLLPYSKAQVVYAAREEMARTVDDVLSRRLRATFLDATAAGQCAPAVAELLSGAM